MGHFNCCHVSDKLKILTTEGGGGVSTVESVIRGLVDYQKKCVAGILKILPTTSEHTVYSVKDYTYTVKVILLYFIILWSYTVRNKAGNPCDFNIFAICGGKSRH